MIDRLRNLETSKPRSLETLFVFAISILFLALRLPLLLFREPFYDELFTLWLARKPLGEVVPALLHDSGPPLYYVLARIPSVAALRWMSLLFAAATVALIVARRSLGPSRFVAALLLAAYPAAVTYAVEARAYALCGLLVAVAVLELDAERPWTAALALAGAAYAHDYGVLFFPLLLLPAGAGARCAPLPRRAASFFAACALFAPGFWLAAEQPRAAMAWNAGGPWWGPLANVTLALALFAAAAWGSWRFAPAVLVPLALVLAFALAGRNVYFPERFESVIAAPLALWIADSAGRAGRRAALALVGVLLAAGAGVSVSAIADYATRPTDDYRAAAAWLARSAPPDALVVATGYLYLETVVLRPAVAFPPEQAEHPGWRARARDGSGLPRATFLWIGERGAPELSLMRGRRIEPLYVNARAMVARVR